MWGERTEGRQGKKLEVDCRTELLNFQVKSSDMSTTMKGNEVFK